MKKFRLIVLLMAILAVSCSEEDEPIYAGGPCSDFEITGVQVENLKIIDGLFNSDNVVEENSNVKWNEFLVRYEVNFEEIAQKNLETSLSCAIGTDVGLDTLYVKTLFDYNETFFANDTINSIVSLNWFKTSSLEEFEEFIEIEEYILQYKEFISGGFDLKLNESPSNEVTPFSVEIEYILNDGKVFVDTTQTINLLKVEDLE